MLVGFVQGLQLLGLLCGERQCRLGVCGYVSRTGWARRAGLALQGTIVLCKCRCKGPCHEQESEGE